MPTKNPIVKHADGQYQFKVPFVIYADFESILVPVSGAPNNPEMSSTRGIYVIFVLRNFHQKIEKSEITVTTLVNIEEPLTLLVT